VSKREADFSSEIILSLHRDEIEMLRTALKQYRLTCERNGFTVLSNNAEMLSDKLNNIILDSIMRGIDKSKAMV
jgi:hypothetical protein